MISKLQLISCIGVRVADATGVAWKFQINFVVALAHLVAGVQIGLVVCLRYVSVNYF